MGSKKKAKKAAAAAKPAAKKPAAKRPAPASANGLTKGDKAGITRFARDLAEEYKDKPNASVYKIRRALYEAPELVKTIAEKGSRAWLVPNFQAKIDALVASLPTTTFRKAMTPEERAAAIKARRAALLKDAKGELSSATLHAMRVAYCAGTKGEERAAAQATFDKAAARPSA